MIHAKNDVTYWILLSLAQTDAPRGAGFLLEEARLRGIGASEATIGRQLRALRAGGYLERFSNQGHRITEAGKGLLEDMQKEHGLRNTLKAFLAESDATNLGNLLDVLIARKALEREAVAQATKNATDEELGELAVIVREQYRRMESGEDYADMSGEFHRTIFKITHVPLLETLYNFIGMSAAWQTFFVGMFMAYDIPANLDHEKILRAMRARNARQAENLMSQHIEDVIENAKKLIALESANGTPTTPRHPDETPAKPLLFSRQTADFNNN